MASHALNPGPTVAPGDENRPCELIEGKGQRWFGWGYHWTILGARERLGVREVLISRDKAPGVPGTKKGAHWIAAWRVQKYCNRSES